MMLAQIVIFKKWNKISNVKEFVTQNLIPVSISKYTCTQ